MVKTDIYDGLVEGLQELEAERSGRGVAWQLPLFILLDDFFVVDAEIQRRLDEQERYRIATKDVRVGNYCWQ